jgi:hypothetical protein
VGGLPEPAVGVFTAAIGLGGGAWRGQTVEARSPHGNLASDEEPPVQSGRAVEGSHPPTSSLIGSLTSW